MLDGPTGRLRFLWTDRASGAGTAQPVIAEVDDDGSAKIVTCPAPYRDPAAVGCTVLGSLSNAWLPARPVWNQHAWSMSHINDDLSVPVDMSPNWPALNTVRSADTLAGGDGIDCNTRPGVVDVCNLDCDEGLQRLVVSVDKLGSASLLVGMVLPVRSEIGGTEVIIAIALIKEPIPAGRSSQGTLFDLDLALRPTRELWLVVEPEDDVDECEAEDNRLHLAAARCPLDD